MIEDVCVIADEGNIYMNRDRSQLEEAGKMPDAAPDRQAYFVLG